MRWGLVPSWVKDPRKFTLLINARSETVREKPAFKNAIKRRRCLIPADGYYEWQDASGRKRPFFIHRRDGQPVGFAALAETWMGPNGEETDSVAIVTAPASRDLAALHHRVPVTIAPEEFERWLDGRAVRRRRRHAAAARAGRRRVRLARDFHARQPRRQRRRATAAADHRRGAGGGGAEACEEGRAAQGDGGAGG